MQSKIDKQVSEEMKPIPEQKYWLLGDFCKKEWLKYHNLNKMVDIVFPIIQFFITILIFILLICSFVFVRGTPLAMLIIVFILYLPLMFFSFYRMIKNKKGFFIYKYWQIAKEIKEQKESQQKKSTSSSSPSKDDLSDLTI